MHGGNPTTQRGQQHYGRAETWQGPGDQVQRPALPSHERALGPDVPFVGADVRRITGLTFDVRFVNDPVGPNERANDSALKNQLADFFADFWFIVRVFWMV